MIGQVWESLDIVGSNGDPAQKVAADVHDAAFTLQLAGARWQDAYAEALSQLGSDVKDLVDTVFTSDGFLELTARAASQPLLQSTWLLVPPVLALLTCTVLFVHAMG